jgi:hypothetical protein
MTIEYDRADVFESAAPYRTASWPWGAFWRRLIDAMKASRERQADRFVSEFLKNHPEYQGTFEFQQGVRDHNSPP